MNKQQQEIADLLSDARVWLDGTVNILEPVGVYEVLDRLHRAVELLAAREAVPHE